MSNHDDLWLWFIDDAPLQALLKAEGDVAAMQMRAATSPSLVRAMSAHMEGRLNEAVSILRTAIEDGETQPESYIFLGQILFETREFDEAATVYQQLLRLDPAHGTAAFNAAVCQERLGHWNEAADLFRRAAKHDSARAEAWLGFGLASLHRRRPEDALMGFDRYLAMEPESEPALFGRAVALQMLRRFDEAGAIYERFQNDGAPSAELLTNLLALAVARKDAVALTRIAAELAVVRPGSRQAVEAEAYAAIVSRDWAAAAKHLADFSEFDALPEDWCYANAYALWRTNRPEQAHEQLDSLLHQKPTHGHAHLLRGVLHEDDGRPADALASYRKAAASATESDAASWNLARLAAAEGKAEACQRAAKALLDTNPQSPEGWFASGLAALLERQHPQAVEAFSEALRLRPGWGEAQWNLGLAQLGAGDSGRAERTLEAARRQMTQPAPAEPLIRAALENKRYEQALQLIENGGESACPVELVYNLAVAFHETGKLDEAESLYRRILDADESFADALVNLGHILLATGRPDEAEALWAEARAVEAAA